MALDHALMSRARQSGEAVLRVYEWDRFARLARTGHQRVVEGHVGGPIEGRGTEQAPAHQSGR